LLIKTCCIIDCNKLLQSIIGINISEILCVDRLRRMEAISCHKLNWRRNSA